MRRNNGTKVRNLGNLAWLIALLIAHAAIAASHTLQRKGGVFAGMALPAIAANCGAAGMACTHPPRKASGFLVDAGITGAWFDTSHDGEGWKIEIIDSTTAVVYWFTFPPPGVTGLGAGNGQAWMIGVGEIQGDKIVVAEATITKGALFGPDFNPDNVQSDPWGSMEFTFNGPNAGTMTYSGPPEWGSGSFVLTRLSSLFQPAAKAQAAAMPENVGNGISGSWFNPAHNGEGWIIEIIDAQTALIFWFTYDDQGNQAWNLGIGQLSGNKIYVDAPIEPKGTEFGSGFQSSDLVNEPWGGYTFLFDGCGKGTLGYGSAKGLGLGFQPIQRLTSIDTVPCTPFDPDTPPDIALAANLADPLVMGVKRRDGLQAEFFGNKETGGQHDGLSYDLTASIIKDVTGRELTILTDFKNRPAVITSNSGSGIHTEMLYDQFDPDDMTMKVTLPDGKIVMKHINLRDLPAKSAGTPNRPAATKPPMRSGRAYAYVTDLAPARDRGYAAPNKSAASASTVTVKRCDAPVDNATVTLEVTPEDSPTLELPAPQSGAGTYSTTIPTTAANMAGQASNSDKCTAFALPAKDDCDFVNRLDDQDVLEVCFLVAVSFNDPDDLKPGVNFNAACVHGIEIMRDACRGVAPPGTVAALDQFLCENITEEPDRSVDAMASTVTLRPIATLPEKGAFVVPAKTAPSQGPFPDFEFLFEDPVTIASFSTSPSDPRPSANYEANAAINCAPADTQVTMSVAGTDGFSKSDSCTITDAGVCNLSVPGADPGVRDTITVRVADGPTQTIAIVF